MKKEDKDRDPMPSPDATPEEIGEFWDTHDLADYWDETEEVEFQIDLRSEQNHTQSDEAKPDLPTTSEDPTNIGLDVVADLALDATIPAPIRKNAFKAFDRLCSALIDVPVGALERRSAEKRAESEARIKIREEITAQIAQQVKVDPEYALKAGHKFAEKIIREQLNVDRISAIAANELKEDESNSSGNKNTNEPNEIQSADFSNQEANSSEKKVIDDDWLNNFETQARQVSTEDMQLRFGRILAGEIRQPGSYSIRAIKILRELDQNAAVLFKKLCSMCIAFERLTDGCVLDARVISFGDDFVQGVPGKYSLTSYEIDVLSDYSLIGSTQHYMYPYNLCIQSLNNLRPQPFHHQGQDWFFDPLDPIQEFRFSGLPFSTVGRELFRIVDQDLMLEYTEELKKYFMKQNLAMILKETK